MTVSFENLPPESRVWIYPSNRPFCADEREKLKASIENFLDQWTAHNQSLEAAYELPYNRFIVIGINQEQVKASGCSIDASVRFIQALEKEFDLVLLDKMNVTFKQGEFLTHKSLTDFKALVKNKSVTANTLVFNNLVDTVAAYRNFWEITAAESWHNRFF